MTEIREVVEELDKARRAGVEAGIELRHARRELELRELGLKASVDYAALGSNNNARDIAMGDILIKDTKCAETRARIVELEDNVDRLSAQYDALHDKKSAIKYEVWARLADAIAGTEPRGHMSATVGDASAEKVVEAAFDELPF